MDDYIIEMSGVAKEFLGITTNNNTTLQLRRGEVHALLGENGAGKSTLIGILFGLYQPEKGSIKVRDREMRIKGPLGANAPGIGMVHQHFKLVHNFTVLQNIVLGVETVKHGFLKMDDARRKVTELGRRYEFYINPDVPIEDITVGMQQRVGVLKMLYRNNGIMIPDEPTTALTPQETDELTQTICSLAAERKSILFITHKLGETRAVVDRYPVLHRRKYIGTVEADLISREKMLEMMAGRKVNLTVEKTEARSDRTVLEVEYLSVQSNMKGHVKLLVNGASFRAQRKEIACITGINDNGRAELAHATADPGTISAGKVTLDGEDITEKNIRRHNIQGLSHIPENRYKYDLILDYSLTYNLVLQQYSESGFQHCDFLDNEKIYRYVDRPIQDFDVRSGEGANTVIHGISGRNQQKAIAAREIFRKHDILLAVQLTRKLDVGAIEYIHRELVKQKNVGTVILFISLELEEVMNLGDRILVIFGGAIVADLNPHEVTIQELGSYVAGAKRRSETDREAHKEAGGEAGDTQ